jgi:DNA modification methylase
MNHFEEWIDQKSLEKLSVLPTNNKSIIVISTFFNLSDRLWPNPPSDYKLSDNTVHLLAECKRVLRHGGLLFIYGLPHHLSFIGQYLSLIHDKDMKMIFKNWIALDIDDIERGSTLKPAHQGLLMFLKSTPNGKSPFPLKTDIVRVPHAYCTACGLNVKDWGGKKHLMNPKGVALSDVWRDLPKSQIGNHIIPEFVLERILALTKEDDASYLHIVQDEPAILSESTRLFEYKKDSISSSDGWSELTSLELDKIYEGDCITFLEKVSSLYPQGIFDLVFADPPYNLKKSYDRYDDALAEKHYIEWCNSWLLGMAKALKPGGSLFVLNLPKWAIHHAAFLNSHLDFRHWIVWDSMSDPRGKLMPAHYSLLYFTKPGAKPTYNYLLSEAGINEDFVPPPDSPNYCLRAGCIKRRKRLGDNKKVELSDIWFDIHRIKHKRDRDAHPCQLPERLMERIILLTTRRGGIVFDPFCGTGTTALAACKLGRNFVTVDIDPKYVSIASQKLEAMRQNANLFGLFTFPRQTVKKTKTGTSKKEIELYLQKLALRLGREPSEEEIQQDNADMLRKIDLIYPTRLAAIKRCRVALKGA